MNHFRTDFFFSQSVAPVHKIALSSVFNKKWKTFYAFWPFTCTTTEFFGGGENKLLKTCFKVQVFENTALSSLCELQKCELVKTVAWHAELSVQSSVHKQKKNANFFFFYSSTSLSGKHILNDLFTNLTDLV